MVKQTTNNKPQLPPLPILYNSLPPFPTPYPYHPLPPFPTLYHPLPPVPIPYHPIPLLTTFYHPFQPFTPIPSPHPCLETLYLSPSDKKNIKLYLNKLIFDVFLKTDIFLMFANWKKIVYYIL